MFFLILRSVSSISHKFRNGFFWINDRLSTSTNTFAYILILFSRKKLISWNALSEDVFFPISSWRKPFWNIRHNTVQSKHEKGTM